MKPSLLELELSQEEVDFLKELLAKYILTAKCTSIYYSQNLIEEAKDMFDKIFDAEVDANK